MSDRSAMYVIPAGQEGLVRRMVSPPLPPGWRFVRAAIAGAEVTARYRHAADDVHASMVLTRADGDAPALEARFLASRPAASVRDLRACLLASVRATESELAWAPASPPRPPPPDETSTRFDPPPAPAPAGDDASRVDAPSAPWNPAPVPPRARPRVDPVVEFFGVRDLLGGVALDTPSAPCARALRRALHHAARGHRAASTRALDRAASLEPASLRVALVVAVTRFALRDYAAAVHELARFAEVATTSRAALVAGAARASLLRRLGWYHEALEALDGLRARFPDEASLHVASALLRGALHDIDGAEAHLRDAHALDPDGVDVPLRATQLLASAGDTAAARAWLDRVLPRLDAASPQLVADVARHAIALGDYGLGEALWRRVLAALPRDVSAHVALGTLDAWRGDATSARAHADAALAVTPTHAPALRLRGAARMLDGDVTAALDDVTTASQLDPTDPEAAVWRAEALLRLGDVEGALAEVQRGAERSDDGSDYVAAQLVRGVALCRAGRFPGMPDHVLRPAIDALCGDASSTPVAERMERALAALRGNRSVTPTRVCDDGSLARVEGAPSPRVPAKRALWRYVETADVDVALAAFAEVHADYPDAAEPSNYEGELHLYAGDYAAARRCFERALSRYGRSRWAFIGLTAVAVLEGRCDAALDVIARGVAASGPPGPTAYVYRGEARRRLGLFDDARADLEHAVQSHPTRVGAWVNLGLLQLDVGDPASADTLRALDALAPGLVADARAELGDAPAVDDVASRRALLSHMLVMLRGNRGSSCVTYFTREGRLRTAPAQSPAAVDVTSLLTQARRSLRRS